MTAWFVKRFVCKTFSDFSIRQKLMLFIESQKTHSQFEFLVYDTKIIRTCVHCQHEGIGRRTVSAARSNIICVNSHWLLLRRTLPNSEASLVFFRHVQWIFIVNGIMRYFYGPTMSMRRCQFYHCTQQQKTSFSLMRNLIPLICRVRANFLLQNIYFSLYGKRINKKRMSMDEFCIYSNVIHLFCAFIVNGSPS